jgi:hypothetical protein
VSRGVGLGRCDLRRFYMAGLVRKHSPKSFGKRFIAETRTSRAPSWRSLFADSVTSQPVEDRAECVECGALAHTQGTLANAMPRMRAGAR